MFYHFKKHCREKSKKALNQECKVYGFSSIIASDTDIVSALLQRSLRMIERCYNYLNVIFVHKLWLMHKFIITTIYSQARSSHNLKRWVMSTLQDSINEFINGKLNPLVVGDFRLISAPCTRMRNEPWIHTRGSLNFRRLPWVVFTPSVTMLLRGENDSNYYIVWNLGYAQCSCEICTSSVSLNLM